MYNIIRIPSAAINLVFGEIKLKKAIDIFLILMFFISLFSATCFFFDTRAIVFLGHQIHFPVGLLFFPATFVISNIIQDRSGREAANTVVACCFLADLMLVGMGWVIAHVGDRADYLTVFQDLPIIMGSTFVFLTVSSILNSWLYKKLSAFRNKSIIGLFISFFTSITIAEIAVSTMSMFLLYHKQELTGNVFLTILVIVLYKIVFNLVATIFYVLYQGLRGEKGIGSIGITA